MSSDPKNMHTLNKRVHGRRTGRPLNKSRQDALDALMPELGIPLEKLKEDGSLTPSSLFGDEYKKCWFEIGFGNGEHLAGLMERHPDTAFIGAEPFINGMSAFLKSIEDVRHDHVRVLMDDAMMIANSLTDNSLDGMYILNPDPWHKSRHHKRRIVRPDTLDQFARIIKSGGQLIMSTDVPDLADWMVTHAARHTSFKWTAEKASDWQNAPKDWITTRYEEKGAKGASIMTYLIFERL